MTVKAHLRNESAFSKVSQGKLSSMVPDAIEAIHKSLKAGDGKLALTFLERMNVFTHRVDNKDDKSLTIAINTLFSAAHPSSHEGGGGDLNLNTHGQNFAKLGPPAEDAEIISEVSDGK